MIRDAAGRRARSSPAAPLTVPMAAPLVVIDESEGGHWVDLSRSLRSCGFEICHVSEPDAASIGAREVVRLVDAVALARAPARPYLVIASVDSPAMLWAALDAGASGFFVAPVQIPSLTAAICVAGRQLRAAAELEERTGKLNDAVDENRIVGVVVGILMERYHLQRDDAFARLRSYSRAHRQRVSEVAKHMLSSTEDHTRLAREILTGTGTFDSIMRP